MIARRRNYKIKSLFVGIIVGVCVQYIVEVVVKLLSKTSLKDSVKVSANWQSYYGAGIAGGINGLLLTCIPSKLFSYSAVFNLFPTPFLTQEPVVSFLLPK